MANHMTSTRPCSFYQCLSREKTLSCTDLDTGKLQYHVQRTCPFWKSLQFKLLNIIWQCYTVQVTLLIIIWSSSIIINVLSRGCKWLLPLEQVINHDMRPTGTVTYITTKTDWSHLYHHLIIIWSSYDHHLIIIWSSFDHMMIIISTCHRGL